MISIFSYYSSAHETRSFIWIVSMIFLNIYLKSLTFKLIKYAIFHALYYDIDLW